MQSDTDNKSISNNADLKELAGGYGDPKQPNRPSSSLMGQLIRQREKTSPNRPESENPLIFLVKYLKDQFSLILERLKSR